MPDSGQPVYLVSNEGDPVRLIIRGRASYTNCGPLQQFFDHIATKGKTSLEIDFADCTGMDSTFMGLLAGAAIQLRQRAESPGKITLRNLSTRNLELIRNLGLHRLLTVSEATGHPHPAFPVHSLGEGEEEPKNKSATQEAILKAHEDLMEADPANIAKFQDVVAYLKREAPPKP